MQYENLCGNNVSRLGLGIMRMPCIGQGDAVIDEEKSLEIMDYLHENGVNYFDTALFYHSGNAERFLGKALKRYASGSYFISTKMPWYANDGLPFSPQRLFELQLEKFGVESFDYYLIQNVHDSTIDTYLNKDLGIVSYLVEQKKKGRIKHLGFSAHASIENLERFMNFAGDHMEFAQLQINYLDWRLQKAEQKLALVDEANLPVVVMEPLRGGRLANVNDEARKALSAIDEQATPAELSLRWIQQLPQVKVVLSGMGTMDAARENVATFDQMKTFTPQQMGQFREAAACLVAMQPCTECRYCCKVCPQGLDIPRLIRLHDDCAFRASLITAMGLQALPGDQRAGACIQCGACASNCPQNINIPQLMAEQALVEEKLIGYQH